MSLINVQASVNPQNPYSLAKRVLGRVIEKWITDNVGVLECISEEDVEFLDLLENIACNPDAPAPETSAYPPIQPSDEPQISRTSKEVLYESVKHWIVNNLEILKFDDSREDLEFLEFLESTRSNLDGFWTEQISFEEGWMNEKELFERIMKIFENINKAEKQNISSQMKSTPSSIDLMSKVEPSSLEKLPSETLSGIFDNAIEEWNSWSFSLITLSKRLHPIVLRTLVQSPPPIYGWNDCYRYLRIKKRYPTIPTTRLHIQLPSYGPLARLYLCTGILKVVDKSQSVTNLFITDYLTAYHRSHDSYIYSLIDSAILSLNKVTELTLSKYIGLNVAAYFEAFTNLVSFTFLSTTVWYAEKGKEASYASYSPKYDSELVDPPSQFPPSLRYINFPPSEENVDTGPIRMNFKFILENSFPSPPLRSLHVHIGDEVEGYLHPLLDILSPSLEELFISGSQTGPYLVTETYVKISQCLRLSCLELQSFRLSLIDDLKTSPVQNHIRKLILVNCAGEAVDANIWIDLLGKYRGELGKLEYLAIDNGTVDALKDDTEGNWSEKQVKLETKMEEAGIQLEISTL